MQIKLVCNMFDLTYSLMMDKRDVIVDGTPFWKTGSGFCNWCDDPTIVYQPAHKSKFSRPRLRVVSKHIHFHNWNNLHEE
jgi:hypothetical protein